VLVSVPVAIVRVDKRSRERFGMKTMRCVRLLLAHDCEAYCVCIVHLTTSSNLEK